MQFSIFIIIDLRNIEQKIAIEHNVCLFIEENVLFKWVYRGKWQWQYYTIRNICFELYFYLFAIAWARYRILYVLPVLTPISVNTKNKFLVEKRYRMKKWKYTLSMRKKKRWKALVEFKVLKCIHFSRNSNRWMV